MREHKRENVLCVLHASAWRTCNNVRDHPSLNPIGLLKVMTVVSIMKYHNLIHIKLFQIPENMVWLFKLYFSYKDIIQMHLLDPYLASKLRWHRQKMKVAIIKKAHFDHSKN